MAVSSPLRSLCTKTRLCKYYRRGRCTQQDCGFAHSVEELRQLPDLACTKVCPTLLRTGRCDNKECTFAHKRAELRKVSLPRLAQEYQGGGMQGQSREEASKSSIAATSCKHIACGVRFSEGEEDPPLEAYGEAEVTTFSRQSTEEGWSRQSTEEVWGPEEGWGRQSTDEVFDRQITEGSGKAAFKAATGAALDGAPPRWDWQRRFHKTALCAFHRQGKCARGAACRFAHSVRELRALPDLSRTRLCEALLRTGSCADPDCRFAHNRKELRAVPRWASQVGGQVASDAPAALQAGALDCGEPPRPPPPEPSPAPFEMAPSVALWGEGEAFGGSGYLILSIEGEGRGSPCQPDVPSRAQPADTRGVPGSGGLARNAHASLPYEDIDTSDVVVKNTFLTIQEPKALQLPPRAKSMPNVFAREGKKAASKEGTIARAPLDVLRCAAGPPQELSEVPVCALQEVGRLVEAPRTEVRECGLGVPAPGRIIVRSATR